MDDLHQAIASIVFMVVYFFFLLFLLYSILTRRPRYMFIGLTIFVAIRLGSQVSGLGFAIVGYDNFNWLIAYLILGAEGYFALILTGLLMTGRYEDRAIGTSFIHPKQLGPEASWAQKRRAALSSGAFWLHMALIPGNILTIVGGSKLAGASYTQSAATTNPASNPIIQEGIHIRLAGQCLFMANAFMCSCISLYTFYKAKRQGVQDLVTIGLICCTIPFMLVRGAFGVLSSASFGWSYYNLNNYGANGIGPKLLVAEYVMGTTMECIAAGFLLAASYRLTHHKSQTKKARAARGESVDTPGAGDELEKGVGKQVTPF